MKRTSGGILQARPASAVPGATFSPEKAGQSGASSRQRGGRDGSFGIWTERRPRRGKSPWKDRMSRGRQRCVTLRTRTWSKASKPSSPSNSKEKRRRQRRRQTEEASTLPDTPNGGSGIPTSLARGTDRRGEGIASSDAIVVPPTPASAEVVGFCGSPHLYADVISARRSPRSSSASAEATTVPGSGFGRKQRVFRVTGHLVGRE